jgi:hypothetical protein
VPERYLPGITSEDVEPEERDQVDPHGGVLARLEVADERRQHRDEHDEGRERDEADDADLAKAHRPVPGL